MGKWSCAEMLDAALDYIVDNADSLFLCAGDPDEYGDIDNPGYEVMWWGPDTLAMENTVFSAYFDGDLTEPPEDTSTRHDGHEDYEYGNTGRAMQVAAQAISSLDVGGFPTTMIIVSMSEMLYKTTISGSSYEAGDPILIDWWNILIHEPT